MTTATGPGPVTAPAPAGDALVIRARGVRKAYGEHEALRGVDLDVREGEVVALIGPSGSGKSTLVRCIDQLERIDGGSLHLDGELLGFAEHRGRLRPLAEKHVAAQRRRMGMVFQQFNLFPHMTALQNVVEAPLRVQRISRSDAVERAEHLLGRVGLKDRMHAYPRQLSGGQQQRVAIARALALRPRVMLFDEPTSALDPELVDEVLGVVKDLARAGKTMVFVTHEIGFAREVADTCVFMEAGRIVESGPANRLLTEPRTERLAAFLRKVR
ncbi:MAG: amino acid ABC transporter ATP-binding protein [Streptomycetaceae bacterium]|jgi:ABC-type polar amino acid transport system ATPase subunit|nr:amino acid ABC transporter ATP-binding protein [Streptomycetaceae bacterium]NUS53547.1 amino acid ABC transporter ATP-binding protein [Streptomycetaceae bacterium]